MKLYLAGKMSGLPDWGFAAFAKAAAELRAQGHDVVSPAELDAFDDEPIGSRPWADYLKRDIPQLLKCDAIALLPNWENSRGARLECHIATELGLDVLYLKEPSTVAVCEAAAEERE